MALQGENIDILLKGDSDINLDDIDFKVTVYVSPNITNLVTISKSSCVKKDTNTYLCTIPYTTTKTMEIGVYTIEILDSTNHTIFQKINAFTLNLSASKTLIS